MNVRTDGDVQAPDFAAILKRGVSDVPLVPEAPAPGAATPPAFSDNVLQAVAAIFNQSVGVEQNQQASAGAAHAQQEAQKAQKTEELAGQEAYLRVLLAQAKEKIDHMPPGPQRAEALALLARVSSRGNANDIGNVIAQVEGLIGQSNSYHGASSQDLAEHAARERAEEDAQRRERLAKLREENRALVQELFDKGYISQADKAQMDRLNAVADEKIAEAEKAREEAAIKIAQAESATNMTLTEIKQEMQHNPELAKEEHVTTALKAETEAQQKEQASLEAQLNSVEKREEVAEKIMEKSGEGEALEIAKRLKAGNDKEKQALQLEIIGIRDKDVINEVASNTNQLVFDPKGEEGVVLANVPGREDRKAPDRTQQDSGRGGMSF